MKIRNIFIILIISALTIFFTGCSKNVKITYDNSTEYEAGNRTINKGISRLDVDWYSGKVVIQHHDKNTIIVEENNKGLKLDMLKVQTWVYEGTLSVKFAKSGVKTNTFKRSNKILYITLPSGKELYEVRVKTESASLEVDGVNSDKIIVSSSSGDVKLNSISTHYLNVSTKSGNINLAKNHGSSSISLSSESGNITASAQAVVSFNVYTTSGNINVTGEKVTNYNAVSDSGKIESKFFVLPYNAKIQSNSGDVELLFRKYYDFNVKVTTDSGKFNSDFDMKKDGDTYLYGTSTIVIKIETTSGNITINEFDE